VEPSGGRSGERAPTSEWSGEARWGPLFARYAPLALKLARGIVRHADQAEDVVQEAARAVLARANAFDTPEHARNYFLRAVHTRALDVLRGSERERVQPAEGLDVPEPAEPRALAFEEQEARGLRVERMRRALEALRPPEREAVRLRYLEGLPYHEIAARTGASISTLHSRVEAGLEKLRGRLAED
jgi:RNA polymerase sigma-70 factor (ECF subfamily)